MCNVTVLKMKDIVRILIGLILTILIIALICKNYSEKNAKEKKVVMQVKSGMYKLAKNSLLQSIEQTIPAMANINKEYKKVANEDDPKGKNILQVMLKTQISSIKGMEEIETNIAKTRKVEDEKVENMEENKLNGQETKEIQIAQTGLTTQVITNNPLKENSNAQYRNVKIKNETSYNLTEEMLKPDIAIDNKNIVIFHTHSCESYTPSEKYQYTQTGTYRTTDLNFTVARVGTELENMLKQYNLNVIHNTNYHDYPSYNGSYTRSLATVENILKTNPSDIIIDLHRDAIGSRSDYAPTVKIGDTDEAAQIMFVIGTNEGGLWHPNWNQNLKFAVKVQEKAEEMYPGLFKPIMLTKSRYNQHTGKYASIMEVGATGNTLEQCLTSMKYLAKVMDEVLK